MQRESDVCESVCEAGVLVRIFKKTQQRGIICRSTLLVVFLSCFMIFWADSLPTALLYIIVLLVIVIPLLVMRD